MNIIKKSAFQDITFFKLGSSYFGKPQMYVHSFLVDGLLIDTGQPNIKNDFLKKLEHESIDRIIVTHHHEDHSGNIEAIKKLKNVEAYGSELCCELMKQPKRIEPGRLLTWGQPSPASVTPLDLTRPIESENYKFEILETPGHSVDQISLYEANQGWLFSGDIFVNDYIKIFMKGEDIHQQISSIKTLLKLEFDTLLCHHQPVQKGGKQRLKNKLEFLEGFRHSVKTEHDKGYSPSQIMKSLGLKEQHLIRALSLGQLSQRNMVKSVIQDQQSTLS